MKSLIYKEWLVCKKNIPLMIYLVGGIVLSMLFGLSPSVAWAVWCACAMIFAFVLPTGFLNTDLTSGWGRFSETLPVKKSNIVSEKFAFGIAGWAWSILLIGLVFVVRYFVHPEILVMAEMLSMLSISALCAIALAIAFPFSFRFGASVGILFQFGILGFVGGFFSGFDVVLTEYGTPEMALTIFIIAVLFYFVSWLLSVRIYKKQGAK